MTARVQVVGAFGRLCVVAGPAAAADQANLDRIRLALDGEGLDHHLEVAEDAAATEDLVRTAIQEGTRFLVAFGTDATVQDVINGLFRDGRPIREDLVLGVVPAGPGSELIRSFGLPSDVEGACRHLVGTNTYPLDLMKVGYRGTHGKRLARYAANLAEVGMGGEVARRAHGDPSNLRRFTSFWGGWLSSKPVEVRVEADTKRWEGHAFNVVVGNGQFSGGLRISPRSFPGDGILDALVFTGPRSDAYTMLPRIYRHGDHIPDPNIHEMRAKIRIAIDADRALAIVADGTVLGTTPATFQVIPQQIALKL